MVYTCNTSNDNSQIYMEFLGVDLLIFVVGFIYMKIDDLWHFCFEFVLFPHEYIMSNISLVQIEHNNNNNREVGERRV